MFPVIIYKLLFLLFNRMLAIANLVRGEMPYVKWGLQKKALDATAVRGIEESDVMEVFIDSYIIEKGCWSQ